MSNLVELFKELENKDPELVIAFLLFHFPKLFVVFELNKLSRVLTNILYYGGNHPGVVIVKLPLEYDILLPHVVKILLDKWVSVRISKTIHLSEQKDWCERNGFILYERKYSTNMVEIKRPR